MNPKPEGSLAEAKSACVRWRGKLQLRRPHDTTNEARERGIETSAQRTQPIDQHMPHNQHPLVLLNPKLPPPALRRGGGRTLTWAGKGQSVEDRIASQAAMGVHLETIE